MRGLFHCLNLQNYRKFKIYLQSDKKKELLGRFSGRGRRRTVLSPEEALALNLSEEFLPLDPVTSFVSNILFESCLRHCYTLNS